MKSDHFPRQPPTSPRPGPGPDLAPAQDLAPHPDLAPASSRLKSYILEDVTN